MNFDIKLDFLFNSKHGLFHFLQAEKSLFSGADCLRWILQTKKFVANSMPDHRLEVPHEGEGAFGNICIEQKF